MTVEKNQIVHSTCHGIHRKGYMGRYRVGMRTLTNYERGFLEALIDGEGCLHRSNQKDRKYPDYRCSIANTCLALLEKARRIILNRYRWAEPRIEQKSVKSRGNRKPCYNLCLNQKILRWLLPQISLVVKENIRLQFVKEFAERPFYGKRY